MSVGEWLDALLVDLNGQSSDLFVAVGELMLQISLYR